MVDPGEQLARSEVRLQLVDFAILASKGAKLDLSPSNTDARDTYRSSDVWTGEIPTFKVILRPQGKIDDDATAPLTTSRNGSTAQREEVNSLIARKNCHVYPRTKPQMIVEKVGHP